MCAVSGVARCFGVTARTAGSQTFLWWTRADRPDTQKAARLLRSCSWPLHEPYIPHTHTHIRFSRHMSCSRSSIIASLAALLCSVAKVVLIHQDNPESINSPCRQILSLITSLWIFISGTRPSPTISSMLLLSIKRGGCSCVFSQHTEQREFKGSIVFQHSPWIHDHCKPILRSERGLSLKLICADCNFHRRFFGRSG